MNPCDVDKPYLTVVNLPLSRMLFIVIEFWSLKNSCGVFKYFLVWTYTLVINIGDVQIMGIL